MAIMTGRAALMEVLRKEGVEYVFGLPGATEIMFLDAMEKQKDIEYILCLNEFVAVAAAEGYARTSGKPGFLNLHTGPGVAASMGILFNAHRGGVPLVITAGQVDSRLLLRDPHLSGKLVEMARPLTKWGAEVTYAADIPVIMQRAFKMAMQPPTGPVFVSLPQDVLNQELDFEYTPGAPMPTGMRPDVDAITRAAEILAKAESPALLVESGVTRSRALAEVVKLAELLGARVYQQWMADVNFPNQHPLNVGEIRIADPGCRKLLEKCDALVAIGCQLFGQELYVAEPLLARHTRVIQIDDDPWEIAKNLPVAVGIQGNIKVSVAELTALLEKTMPAQAKSAAKSRVSAITRETGEAKAAFLKQAEADRKKASISNANFILALKDALRPGTIVVDDCWSTSNVLRRLLDFSEPGSFQRARGGGSIGEGLPSAIGVKLAAPERPVVAICGDGSAIWSIQSLWTAARYKLPITHIIAHNTCYQTVKNFWTALLGGKPSDRHVGLQMDKPVIDFCKAAESMGVHAVTVSRPEELAGVLKSALESNQPNLVEVRIE